MSRTYYIDSDEVIVAPNWSITDKINARSTINITLVDKQNATIEQGKTFTIYNNAVKFFEGLIIKATTKEVSTGYLEYKLTIADNSSIADRRVIAKVYTNTKAGDIVKDLITQVLGDEGITQGTIQDGATISKAVFNYISVAQALDYLKKTTGGYVWNIDKDKKLHFFDRATNVSPFTLNSTIQHSDFEQNSTIDQYRNTQYLRGGKGKTGTQSQEVPTPKPDGESRNFLVRFPVAEEPTIEINLAGGGWNAISSSDVGINGLDENKKWYWAYNSQILTQADTETVLGTSDAIRITYKGLRNLFTKIDNPAEIADRKAIEGGTGIYENTVVEKSIDEASQAQEYCDGLLATYGEIKDTIRFKTEVAGLEAGQILDVDKTLYGISDRFLIESINITPADSSSFEYTVTALDGAAVGGWEEFFKELLREGRDFAIAENEVLITLNKFEEAEGIGGSLNIKVFDCLYPAEDLYPSETLYPNTAVKQEVDLDD